MKELNYAKLLKIEYIEFVRKKLYQKSDWCLG